jgi:hypothetical protein
MSVLYDKFNIIENPIKDVNSDELLSDINNYFENLLLFDEKIMHQDYITSISRFQNKIDYTKILTTHLENYLKQKRLSIRNNIKKGNFEIDSLIKLIQTYSDKIINIEKICNNNEIKKISSLQLYEQIILENSLNGFLKNELSTIEDSKFKTINDLIYRMKSIFEDNPQTGAYEWFLFLISSALASTVEENLNKTFPVPENYQKIINFCNNLQFCSKIFNFYNKTIASKDVNIILNGSVKLLGQTLIDIFNNSSLNKINSIFKNNSEILDILINRLKISSDNKTIKEIISNKFFIIIENNIRDFKDDNLEILIDLTECLQIFDKFLFNIGSTRDIINNKLSLIFSNEKTQNFLIENIHQNIIKSSIDNDFENNEQLAIILSFCSNIKEKDKFIEKYNKLLILRLLNNPKIEIEHIYLNMLIEKFGQKLLFKTKKIITDTDYTLKDIRNFNKLNVEYSKFFNPITTSYDNWDINQCEGLITSQIIEQQDNRYETMNILFAYQNFYDIRYSNKRKLNWYPHFGEVIFDYMEKEIKMLPIQFMILEKIFDSNRISKDNLIDYSILANYNIDFKKSLISSLLHGGIIKINEDNISLTTDVSNISTNYIDIFFTTTNYANIWEQRMMKELIMNRQDIINSQINHFVKKSPLSKEDLYKKVSENINVFELTMEIFDKSITYMIDNDYIKLENGLFEKLFY